MESKIVEYAITETQQINCVLCDGSHGNNSMCQMQGGEAYV
jgi:hypothetical protein